MAAEPLFVDAENQRVIDIGRAAAWMRDQYTRTTGLNELLQLRTRAVAAGAFDQQIKIVGCPVDVFCRRSMTNVNGFAINQQTAIVVFDFPGENAVRGIKFGKVSPGCQIGRLVDEHHLDLPGQAGFVQGTHDTTANAAITIDGHTQRTIHDSSM